jgi:TonB-linked SusC/RagA family outer membrane protein
MKELKLLLCFIMLATVPTLSFSQGRTVTGQVTDNKDNSPLVDATVSVVGKPVSTKTKADGTFSINVPTGSNQLRVTYVGYQDQTISITSANVSISMSAATTSLTDVVVIGYGTARRRDVTGSVSSVKAKDFNQGPAIAAPDQLLQNKVAGLEVTNTSGQPGAATTIKIRGNSSIRSGNNPLFVVDGVPLSGSSARPDIGAAFGGTPASNPLLFIDPNNIAQIDVLKDASSAAIYGSRGANGVIVITTKKGTSGATTMEVGTSFSSNVGYMKRFPVLNASQFQEAITKYGLGATLNGGSSSDALAAITQHTLSQNYNVAFSGGNESGRFRASFLGSRNEGFIKNSRLDKYIGTFNGGYKFLDKKLSIDFNLIAANYGESLVPVSNNAGSQGNLVTSALQWNPTFSFRSKTGVPASDGSTYYPYYYPTNGSGNPLALLDAYSDKTNVNTFLGNISASYKLLENLEYKILYGANHSTGQRLLNIQGFVVGYTGLSGQGNAALANAVLTSTNLTHTLNYRAEVSKSLTIDALLGYEYFKTNYSSGAINGSGFNTNLDEANRINIPYTSIFQNARQQNPYGTGATPTTEIQSYFARANFNIQDKYILTGTIRADGSSKFGANNRYGYFPSVGARWVLSNENFMKGGSTFSNVSIRGSYGITGNQEFPAGSSREQFGLSSYNSAPQTVNGNPNLKWETTKAVNIGADFGLSKGRISASFDYYYKNTSDILFQTNAIQPAPNSVSYINLPANLINTGFEVALGATLIDKKALTWDASVNVAYNKNLIKNFLDINTGLPLQIITGEISGQGVSGTLSQVITNNYPVNEYYLKQFNGFDVGNKQTIGDNPIYAGDPNPHVLAGFSTSLRYNKLTLSINTGGAFGFLIYNNTSTSVTNVAGIAGGRNIDVKAYNSGEGISSGVGASTRFLEKGDYYKLRNATLRYNLGNAGKYVRNLSAFVSGSNLFVITKFTGFDPEVNVDKSSGAYPSRSIEYVPYPTPRTVSFGVNFSL